MFLSLLERGPPRATLAGRRSRSPRASQDGPSDGLPRAPPHSSLGRCSQAPVAGALEDPAGEASWADPRARRAAAPPRLLPPPGPPRPPPQGAREQSPGRRTPVRAHPAAAPPSALRGGTPARPSGNSPASRLGSSGGGASTRPPGLPRREHRRPRPLASRCRPAAPRRHPRGPSPDPARDRREAPAGEVGALVAAAAASRRGLAADAPTLRPQGPRLLRRRHPRPPGRPRAAPQPPPRAQRSLPRGPRGSPASTGGRAERGAPHAEGRPPRRQPAAAQGAHERPRRPTRSPPRAPLRLAAAAAAAAADCSARIPEGPGPDSPVLASLSTPPPSRDSQAPPRTGPVLGEGM